MPVISRAALRAAAIATVSTCSISLAAVPAAGDYSFQLQVRGNLAANPGGSFNVPHGTTFNSTTVSMNNLGEVASKISTVGTSGEQGIFYGPGNGTGGVVAQPGDIDALLMSDVNIGDTGRIITSFSFSSGVDGFHFRDRGQAFGLTYAGAAAGSSGSGYRVLPDNSISSRTSIGGVTGHRRFTPPSTVQTYITQSAGGFSFLGTAAPSDNGQIASRVFNDAEPAASNDQVRRFNSNGTSTLIATEGGTLPGVAGTITSFSNSMAMNSNGFVAFLATTTGGLQQIVLSDGTTTRVIANASSPIVSGIDFFAPAVNSAGLVAFRGKDEAGNDAIFIGDGTNLTRVIGELDQITSDLGLAQLGQNVASDPTFSGGIALNDSNQIAFTTGLYPNGNSQIEWGTAIYVASVPEPATISAALIAAGSLVLRRRR